MKIKKYIIDHWLSIIIYGLSYFIIIMILIAFKTQKQIIQAISFVMILLGISLLLINYYRKKNFYNNLIRNLEQLDKKYLILELLEKPNFYEGEILLDILYEINKSMNEKVKEYESQTIDFKEYIEMWIHEVKIPISSLMLISHNHKDKFDKTSINQMKRIENYVEQVLYYVRSENAEKDYLIKETPLNKVISAIALKNKDELLENKIDLRVENTNCSVLTDSKWLEFILNQIINNSIKYKTEKDPYIKITTQQEKNRITLIITDNGIGINKKDLPKVFEKTFTGENGRKKAKSTGMGLYIAKNLCKKLGHKIEISSEINQSTTIKITFAKNDFYKMDN